MKIDLDKLSEAELIDLNHRIIQRLRILRQQRTDERMLMFKIGERVTFHPEGRPSVTGMVTWLNKKTVTVITDGGEHWNIPPRFLEKAAAESEKKKSKVVRIK